jgi:hypothetical protein
MAHLDGEDRFILFGGNDYSGPSNAFHHLDDTWFYRWQAKEWSLLPTTTRPPARDYPLLAFDRTAQRVLLAGGYGNGTILNDLWAFDTQAATWVELNPGFAPPARFAAVGGFDIAENAVVLFGGLGNTGLLADTWHYIHEASFESKGGNSSALVLGIAFAGAVGIAFVGVLGIIRRIRSRTR